MRATKQIRRLFVAAAAGFARLFVAASAGFAGLLCAASASQAALRPADPLVLAGSDVPALLGSAPGSGVAFSRTADKWQQIPVQVDERAVVDLGKVYGVAPSGVTTLTYTDPNTFTGPDPDPALDADDEIALMARDAGERFDRGADPTGTVSGSGVEVHASDPLDGGSSGYVYLFRSDGSLS